MWCVRGVCVCGVCMVCACSVYMYMYEYIVRACMCACVGICIHVHACTMYMYMYVHVYELMKKTSLSGSPLRGTVVVEIVSDKFHPGIDLTPYPRLTTLQGTGEWNGMKPRQSSSCSFQNTLCLYIT